VFHDCAYNSINMTEGVYLIPNPQINRFKKINFDGRSNSVFSLQTFKRWKRVDDLVRAVPYIEGDVFLAGGGIEYYYMTSTDKMKKEYKGIWNNALQNGMAYLGYLPEKQRDEYLQKCKLLVDPSWSKSYGALGSHFNRTFVDAIIAGCMPAGRDLLMDENSFFPKDLYVTIPYNATPEEFGEIVNSALNMHKSVYTKRVANLQTIVADQFDSVKVAQRYIDLV
jgi:glycosyltransferase involved in cell wall biosynthesis